MSPEPEKAAASPGSETAAAPAPAAVPSFGGKTAHGPGRSGPGEPYTPMPDFSRPARPKWVYAAAALLLALAAAVGLLFMRGPAATPAAQQAPITAPAAPGPGN